MTHPRPRHWFQLSLKSLFLLTLLVATFFAGYSLAMRRADEAVRRAEEAMRAEQDARRIAEESLRNEVEAERRRLEAWLRNVPDGASNTWVLHASQAR
jgi:hypothetical protein